MTHGSKQLETPISGMLEQDRQMNREKKQEQWRTQEQCLGPASGCSQHMACWDPHRLLSNSFVAAAPRWSWQEFQQFGRDHLHELSHVPSYMQDGQMELGSPVGNVQHPVDYMDHWQAQCNTDQ